MASEPLRFSITWRDGMYRVSVPNIVGVEVVEAAAYDELRTQLADTAHEVEQLRQQLATVNEVSENAHRLYHETREQLAAAEQARDIATQREEHFHTVNTELAEKLTEVKRERNVAYDARRNADIYARRYEEQAESAKQERDAARAQLTDANQEIAELRTVIQKLVGVMESAPEDFVPQHRHFVVAPDGTVCALHHGEYTPEMFDEAWNVPAGSHKSIPGYVVTKKYLDHLRARVEQGIGHE